LRRTCYRRTTYLDRFYSILPGPMKGSKRLVVLLDASDRERLGSEAIAALEEFAAIVWRTSRPGPLAAAGTLESSATGAD